MLILGDMLAMLAGEFDARLIGNGELRIEALSTLEQAGPHDLTFLSNPKYISKLPQSLAGCIVAGPASEVAAATRGTCIIVADPYRYFARITQIWKQQHGIKLPAVVHATAFIDPLAEVSPSASIGAFACIGPGAVIAEGARIAEHCVIGRDAFVGSRSHLAAHVTLGDRCRIGERCIVHAGVVIGADGFGFAPHAEGWEKIEQLGAVSIGNDVEIGANTCIDRGALTDTVVEDGVKLDNLIQIGHNVRVGAHSALAGCVGVAGSATIGAHCTVGGGAVVLGHLQLADHVHISAASVVTRSILKPGNYTGLFPIDDNTAWEKNAATLKQLHGLRDRVKQLEKTLQDAATRGFLHTKEKP